MRTYRLEIRLIQAAVILALLVFFSGFTGIWGINTTATVSSESPGTGPATTATAPPITNPKIVALGDSFTLGYPVGETKSWTKRLEEKLQVPVVNKGKARQTAKDLLARFDGDVVKENPGRVIIFVGNGDALQDVQLKDFQANIQAMIEKAKSNHIVPVLALPVPYPGVQDKIKLMRDWELNYAQSQKITTLDFASVLYDAQGKFLDGLSNDGKYPTAKGYEVMGDYAARVLK